MRIVTIPFLKRRAKELSAVLILIGGNAPSFAQSVLASLQSPSEVSGGSFGFTSAQLGDVDVDGVADFAIGSLGEDGLSGAVHIFSGASLVPLYSLISPNGETSGRFGISIGSVPDLNNDAIPDVLVGAYFEDPDPGAPNGGRAYVFDGSDGSLLHTLRSPDEQTSGFFGAAVVGLQDIDLDGFGDICVGAAGEGPDGVIHIFSGFLGTYLRTIPYPQHNVFSPAFFGQHISCIDDLNANGFDDIIAGTPDAEVSGVQIAGNVNVVDPLTGSTIFTIESPDNQNGGFFGFSVAEVNDLNDDGLNEIVIGALGEDDSHSTATTGRAYVVSGDGGEDFLYTWNSASEDPNGRFGIAVNAAGDTNNDGVEDIIVGADLANSGSDPFDSGAAYVYSGIDGNLIASLRSPNPEASGNFGQSVLGVSDLNNDDFDDVLVGASNEELSGSPSGAGVAYLISPAITTEYFPGQHDSTLGFDVSPNPTHGLVTIKYVLDSSAEVRVSIYDILGRLVVLPLSEHQPPGPHEVTLDAGSLLGGVYLALLEVDGRVHTRRITLVR